jgi:NADH dehydrogenase
LGVESFGCQEIARICREQAFQEGYELASTAMTATHAFAGRVLVTGANGSLGRALIQHLHASGVTVRALVRSERAAATLRLLVSPPELAIVDWSDAPGLARAAEGCDAAVHLVGVLKETPTQRYADAHEGTARALATAATHGSLRRIVYLSIVGADLGAENACLASKARAEAILLEAPLTTTVLRLPMVLGGDDPATWALRARARGRLVPLVRGGASLEQPIDARDVVAAIAAALERPQLASRVLDVAGPESLARRELVRRTAALLGNTPRFVSIPLALVRGFAALAERVSASPPITTAMLDVLEHDDRVDPKPACDALGITLTPLDETLQRVVASGDGNDTGDSA